MPVHDTERSGEMRYVATNGHLSATGWTPGMAARKLASQEEDHREAQEAWFRFVGECFDSFVKPLLANAVRACCNLVIRPIPTFMIGATLWGLHWVAMLVVPAGSWWAWGAHAGFGIWGISAMASEAAGLEEIEGMMLTGLTEAWPAAYQVAYWAAMAASVWASGSIAALVFDWAVSAGILKGDAFPNFRDGVQLAAAVSTFVWRGDHHPTLERPAVPWLGW